MARVLDWDTPEFMPRSDIKSLQTCSPKGAISNHVRGDRNVLQKFSFRRKNIDAGPVF
jgi:hypothetical protein